MNHFALFALALGAALTFAGCPGPAPQKPARRGPIVVEPVKTGPTGEERYKSTCSACHGPDARGLPNVGKDLVVSEFGRSQTDQQLLEFIKKGRMPDDPLNTTKLAMPPKGGNPSLSDGDILSIIAHVRSLQAAAKP